MKINILILLITISGLTGFAQQPYESVLKAVETNNTTLKALRQTAEAQKLENKTGIFLPGKAEFGYLWGNSAAGANRTDINITQSFDIPTITGMKGRMAGKQNQAVDWLYASNRKEILLEAKLYCIDLVYLNAMANEMNKRLEYAREMEQAFSRRFKAGEANILKYNNMQLILVSIQGELEQVETERQMVSAQLKRLNGGTSISLNDTEYGSVELPELFEEWYARTEQKNPSLHLPNKKPSFVRGWSILNDGTISRYFRPDISAKKLEANSFRESWPVYPFRFGKTKTSLPALKLPHLLQMHIKTISGCKWLPRLKVSLQKLSG